MRSFNPDTAVNITPAEYELQVRQWLVSTGHSLESFQTTHLKHLEGPGGEYEIDIVAEFTILDGARIVVLIECKRYSSPVKRDLLMTLWAKKEDLGAHKAMMFATCGFQSGALEYARSKGMATLTFFDGKALYETKGMGSTPSEPPPWVYLPRYGGAMITPTETGTQWTAIDAEYTSALAEWLTEAPASARD